MAAPSLKDIMPKTADLVIQKFMTPMPSFIGPDATLSQARKAMDDFGVRHLPIVEGMKIIGLVSDRDLKMALGILGENPRDIKLREIIRHEPYIVDPMAPLREVVDTMSKKQFGSALVAQNGKLVGIFTRYDACRALSHLLSRDS